MTDTIAPVSCGLPEALTMPGSGLFIEGVILDGRTGAVFASSMDGGTIFRAPQGRSLFEVFQPAGANGCTSATGLRIDPENRRLIVCGGVTGLAFAYDADTGAPLGRYSNGLTTEPPKTMKPNADAPTFVNDVAIIAGDAYFTDSYDAALYRLTKASVDATVPYGEGVLERWLPFEGTVIAYRSDDTIPGRFNLNGIEAAPDGRYLVVVQTNTGKLFRIDVASRAVIEIVGEGNPGGDGLLLLSEFELLSVDMTKQPTLTRLRLADDYGSYEVVGRFDAPGNVSPTSAQVVGDRLLLTESQIWDVLIGGEPEHLPYRITVHPLAVLGRVGGSD